MSREYIEANVELPVCEYAESRGWLVRKLKWIGRRAAMDRLFARNGRVVLVEFKRPGEEPEPLQVREINRFRKAGIEVHVIDNVQEGYALFR